MRHGKRTEDAERARLLSARHSRNLHQVYQEAAQDEPKPEEAPTEDTTDDGAKADVAEERERRESKLGNKNGERRASRLTNNDDRRRSSRHSEEYTRAPGAGAGCPRFLDGTCNCLSCAIKNIMNNEYCGLSLLVLLFLMSVLLAFVFMTRTLQCVSAPAAAASRQLKEPVHTVRLLRDTTAAVESAAGGGESWSGGRLLDANRFKRASPARAAEGEGAERGGRRHQLSEQRASHAEPAAAGQETALAKFYEKLLKTDEKLQQIKRMATQRETHSEPDVRRSRRSLDIPPRPSILLPDSSRPRLGRNSTTAEDDEVDEDDGYMVEQERVVLEIATAPEKLQPSHNANVATKSPHAPETVTKSHEKKLNHPFFKNSQHHDEILQPFVKINFKHLELSPDKGDKIMAKDENSGSNQSDITTRKDRMSVWKDLQVTEKDVSGTTYDEDLDYTNVETSKLEPSEELEKVAFSRGYNARSKESPFEAVSNSNGMHKTRKLLQADINEKDEIKFARIIDDSDSDGRFRKKRNKDGYIGNSNVNLDETLKDNELNIFPPEKNEYILDSEISKIIKKRESNVNNTDKDYRSIFRYAEESVSAIVRDPSIKENMQLEKRYESQFNKDKKIKNNEKVYHNELSEYTLSNTNGKEESVHETTEFDFNEPYNIGKIDANSKEGKLSQDYSDYGVLDEKKNYNMYEERKRSQPDDSHKKSQRSIDLRKNPLKHTTETTTKEKLFGISICSNKQNAKDICICESIAKHFKFKIAKDKCPSKLNVQPESEMPVGYDSLIQLENELRSSEVRNKRVADLPDNFVLQEDSTEVNYNGPSNLEPSLEMPLTQSDSVEGTETKDDKRYNSNDREDIDIKVQPTFKSRSLLSVRLHNLDSADEPFDRETEIYDDSGSKVTENGLHLNFEKQNRLYNLTDSAFEYNDKLLSNDSKYLDLQYQRSSYQDSIRPNKINKRSFTQHKRNFASYSIENNHDRRPKIILEEINKPNKEYEHFSTEENTPQRDHNRKPRRNTSGVARTEYEKVNTNQQHEDEDFGIETYRRESNGVQNKEHNFISKNGAKEKEQIHSKDEEMLKITPEDSSTTIIVESKTADKFHHNNEHTFNTHNMVHFESIGANENIPSVDDSENREKIHPEAEHAKIRPLKHSKYTTKTTTKGATTNEHTKKSWILQEWKKMKDILNKPRVIIPYVTATTNTYGMRKPSLLSLNHDSIESDSNALEEDTGRDMLRNAVSNIQSTFDKKDYGGVEEDGAGAVDWTRLTRQLEGVCARAVSEVAAVTRLDERSLSQYGKGLESEQSVELMQQLVRLMGELVEYQAQRRTCHKLPADLEQFLVWLTSAASDSPPPLPDAPRQRQPLHASHAHPAELLDEGEEAVSSSEYERTIGQLQDMLDEYNNLQEEDQSAMRDVRGYLADHINYLQRLRSDATADTSSTLREGRSPRKLTVSLEDIGDIERFKREINASNLHDPLEQSKLYDKCETRIETEAAQGKKEKKKHFHSRKRRRDCHGRIRKSPKSSERQVTQRTSRCDDNNETVTVKSNI